METGFDGIITDDSAASLTLKRAEGVTETVLRRAIAQLFGSSLSLMPEGVESGITVGRTLTQRCIVTPSPRDEGAGRGAGRGEISIC